MYNLRIRHAKQVVLVCNNKERILKGESMKKLAVLEGGQNGGVSIVVNNAGKIECIDLDSKIDQNYQNCTFIEEIDASGMCVLPGKLNIILKVSRCRLSLAVQVTLPHCQATDQLSEVKLFSDEFYQTNCKDFDVFGNL